VVWCQRAIDHRTTGITHTVERYHCPHTLPQLGYRLVPYRFSSHTLGGPQCDWLQSYLVYTHTHSLPHLFWTTTFLLYYLHTTDCRLPTLHYHTCYTLQFTLASSHTWIYPSVIGCVRPHSTDLDVLFRCYSTFVVRWCLVVWVLCWVFSSGGLTLNIWLRLLNSERYRCLLVPMIYHHRVQLPTHVTFPTDSRSDSRFFPRYPHLQLPHDYRSGGYGYVPHVGHVTTLDVTHRSCRHLHTTTHRRSHHPLGWVPRCWVPIWIWLGYTPGWVTRSVVQIYPVVVTFPDYLPGTPHPSYLLPELPG